MLWQVPRDWIGEWRLTAKVRSFAVLFAVCAVGWDTFGASEALTTELSCFATLTSTGGSLPTVSGEKQRYGGTLTEAVAPILTSKKKLDH
jgi:hypothetical protein